MPEAPEQTAEELWLETLDFTRFGHFSRRAADEWGSVIYERPNGEEVEVTNVSCHQNPIDGGYKWPDAVLVGEVTGWLRSGRQGSSLREEYMAEKSEAW